MSTGENSHGITEVRRHRKKNNNQKASQGAPLNQNKSGMRDRAHRHKRTRNRMKQQTLKNP